MGDERSAAYTAVAEAWAAGRLRLAAAILESLLTSAPHDLLGARMLHDTYYSLGDAANLRNSSARVLQAWDPGMPFYSRVAGMAAFGFGECGQYDRAEELAMQALGSDPGDVWAAHAAIHVYDATSRLNEGDRLLRELRSHWEGSAQLSHHLHWHWALLNLEEGQHGEAMTRFDDAMVRGKSNVFTACDDAAMLWRMELARRPLLCPPVSARCPAPSDPVDARYLYVTRGGDDDGDADNTSNRRNSGSPPTRWSEVVRRLRPYLGTHVTPLNDCHMAMALVAAGEEELLDTHLAGMRAAAEGAVARAGAMEDCASAICPSLPPSLESSLHLHTHSRWQMPLQPLTPTGGLAPNASVARQLACVHDLGYACALAGCDMAEGMVAFWRGQYERSCDLLLRSRPHWHVIGGSNAQRDVFHLTLAHAASAAGRWEVAGPLLSERVGLRFASPQSWYMLGSCLLAAGDGAQGTEARNRAFMLGLGQTGPQY